MSAAPLPEHRLVVGLEVHVQLRTRTKCFCPCALDASLDGPNARTCPACLGLPGGLPVLSREALRLALRAAAALDCTIADTTWWDRKHYGYADLPRGYQITQHAAPVGTNGRLSIETPEGTRRITVRRVHLEEDTGRSTHGDDGTRIDFDRAGTPLLEIVTAPDLRSAEEVRAALTELRALLRWIDVSDAEMENGGMRCEPNVNLRVRTAGAATPSDWVPTPIAEIKNVNSIAATVRAVEHERARQLAELAAGGARGPLPRSTRGWDDVARRTHLQRAKEEAADYRFLPDPDLPVVTGCRALAAAERDALPEPARERRARLVAEHGLSAEAADVLTSSRLVADWYERAVAAAGDAGGAVAAWVVGDVLRWFEHGAAPRFSPEQLGSLVREVERGRVPRDAARRGVLPAMAAGRDWRHVVAEEGLAGADDEEVAAAVRAAVAARPELVERARGGHEGVLDVLVGDVMARTRGRAEGAHVRALVRGIVTGISDSAPTGSLGPDEVPPEA